MKPVLIYLLQVIIISGILYGYYHLALRNKKFHQYNRYYLLAALVLSIVIPFLNIPVYFSTEQTDSSFVLQTLSVISTPVVPDPDYIIIHKTLHASGWNWKFAGFSAFCLIAGSLLLRIVISFLKIRRITKKYPIIRLGKIIFLDTNEPGTPFSFFNWLFWNKNIELDSEKGDQIFRHELYHITQKHSCDIICMELLMVFFWFNPFFHLIKKEVKAIHEFLADRFAVSENKNWKYAELLLMQSMHTDQRLVNPFFHNQIKRRIAMITTSKKPSHQYFRKLMVLPVAAMVIGLFAFNYSEKTRTVINNKNLPLSDAIRSVDTIRNTPITIDWIEDFSDPRKSPSLPNEKVSVKKYILIRNNGALLPDRFQKFLIVIDGIVRSDITTTNIENKIKVSTIESITVLKDNAAIAKYGEKGKNGVIEIITKKDIKVAEITLPESKPTDTTKPGKSDNIIFDKVEIEPSFPGGERSWLQYLESNMDISVPVKQKAPDGAYSVNVQFIVDDQGFLSDIKTLTHHGYGMEAEAIRLISKGPNWIPASQNGKTVRAYKKQPITFNVGKGQMSYRISKANGSGIRITSEWSPNTDDKLYEQVDIKPSFPGGEIAFRRFIDSRMTVDIDREVNGLVTASVDVEFTVDSDGSISDVKTVEKNDESDFGKYAVELIKNGPKWVPGFQNNRSVKTRTHHVVDFIAEIGTINKSSDGKSKFPGDYNKHEISVNDLRVANIHKLLQLPSETEILSYVLSMTTPTDDWVKIQFANAGNSFSKATVDAINRAQPGRFIIIDDIRIRKDGIDKKISARSWYVKN